VQPGETFEVQTQINRGPWLADHPDGEALSAKLYDFQQPGVSAYENGWSVPSFVATRLPGGNPSSGCVYIEGVNPGDALHVKIGSIQLDPLGFTSFGGNNPAVPGWFGPSGLEPASRIVRIEAGKILWDERITLTARPMLGMIGAAPARERVANNWGGHWGGNMDVQELTTGATLILRANVAGGLLHVGDMHAIQGDGEICGAGGIETSGLVRLTVEVRPAPLSLFWPRLENETHIGVIACARPMEDAFRYALEGLVLWLEESYGFEREQAFLLLGQVMEARCTAIVNPTFSYIAKIAKKFLP